MKQPWVNSFMSTAAGGNSGRIFMRLTPRKERKSAMELVQELRPIVSQVPGINAYPQVLPPIRIGGNLTKSQYQFTLQTPDNNELYSYAPKLEANPRNDPQLHNMLQDVTKHLYNTNTPDNAASE